MELPEDVLKGILSYLDVCELMDFVETIPNFKHLIWHPKLWVEVDFQCVFCFSDYLPTMMQSNASQVTTLTITKANCFHTNKKFLRDVVCAMSNVKYLDLA